MRFFRGSHFVLVGWHNLDFSIFYFGIGSAYLELPIGAEVEIRLSIKMCPLGAPRPPATKISSPDMTRFQAFARFMLGTVWADRQPLQHSLTVGPHLVNFLNGTGNSFPMLIFKNFKVVIKKWNQYHAMAGKIHIAKWVFIIFKVTDFCFIDRAWKIYKHKNTAMEF